MGPLPHGCGSVQSRARKQAGWAVSSLSDSNTRGPKHRLAPAIAALHLIHHHSWLVSIRLDRGNGFVQLRIKGLSHAAERCHALCFQHGQQPPMDGLQSFEHGRIGVTDLLQGAIEAVQGLNHRKYDLALAALRCTGTFALHTAAIVVEIRQRAQIHLVLLAHLFLKLLYIWLRGVGPYLSVAFGSLTWFV